MRERQRAQAVDAVLEGRDTGSVVCPDADLKVYLVASAGVRAARRAAELDLPVDEVERSIVRARRARLRAAGAGAGRAW